MKSKRKQSEPNVEQNVNQRCEGMVRNGGIFTLGPVRWVQCEESAVVMLQLKNPDEKRYRSFPACMNCWEKAQDPKWGIKIKSATPIRKER